MKTSVKPLVMLGAALLAGSAFAQDANLNSSGATLAMERAGIGGTDVGLDLDQGRVLTGRTDARGQIEILAPQGMHGLLLPAVQACREAARRSSAGSPPPGGVIARVEVGRLVQTSAPLMFDSRDPGRFVGADGRRLMVEIPREGARVRVTLVPCCWATDARAGEADTARSRERDRSGSLAPAAPRR